MYLVKAGTHLLNYPRPEGRGNLFYKRWNIFFKMITNNKSQQ